MISIAKRKNKNIQFICEDVLRYQDCKTYDLVTLTCDAINHFIGEDELNLLFKNINNLTNKNGYLVFDMYDTKKIEFNKEIIVDRDNDIKVYYYITPKTNFINTNVKVSKNNNFIYETNIIEKMYSLEYVKNLLEVNGFKIIKAENKIFNEKQRFNDKVYIICEKYN